MTNEAVEIRISPSATELERFAADELAQYLNELFGVSAHITSTLRSHSDYLFVLGLQSDPIVTECAGKELGISDQGHVVRRISRDTMLLAGGSPAAVAWAVYELVERYGVRYLLHEDLLPDTAKAFHLPDVDVVLEPVQRIRAVSMFVDLPTGSILWTAEQNRAFLAQVFKLKINGVRVHSYPQAPVVSYEVAGIRRSSGQILFGQKIPIDSDNIGYDQLPHAPFLTNPELAGKENTPEFLEAGKRLVHGIIDEARRLGMHVAMPIQPMEFPLEFKPLLEKPSGAVQLGGLTVAETGDLTNPNHTQLVRAQIEAYLDTYPGIDELTLELPENPQAGSVFPQCWRELADKYHLEPEFDIDEALSSARRNHLPAGGPKRAEREFKSTISMLHFYDWFFAGNDLIEKAKRQGTTFGVCVPIDAVEAYPIFDKVMWEGATFCTCLDYSSSRAVRSMRCFEEIDTARLPCTFMFRFQDDNIGSLPQVTTENMHIVMQEMHRLGWDGYQLIFWPIGDLDPMMSYVARASWDATLTPRDAYRDHFERVYGKDCVEPFCQVMRMLEDTTVLLDIDLGPLFPVHGVMEYRAKSCDPMSTVLFHIRGTYEQARITLKRLWELPMSDCGKSNLAYWISRLEFSIHALTEIELLHEGGMAVHRAMEAGKSEDKASASAEIARARDYYARAVQEGEAAMTATASQLRDSTDRATLAAYYHFLVREVRQVTEEFLRSAMGE